MPSVYGIRYTLTDEEGNMLKRHARGDDKDEWRKFQDAYGETPKVSLKEAMKLTYEDMHSIWGVKGPHRHQLLS